MKTVVYAISKNEERFVSRWVKSMSEADEIFVLDTGSSDDTVSALKKLGVRVFEHTYSRFRFDEARNDSLSLLPCDTDICVCVDLDEVFSQGWRRTLEQSWQKNTRRAYYDYVWSRDENGNPALSFFLDKIHSRYGFEWTYPVHEVLMDKFLSTQNQDACVYCPITLSHYPDKTKPRSSYLELLKLQLSENPTLPRAYYYLAREYAFYADYADAILLLKAYLRLKNAVWDEERGAVMRLLGRCYDSLSKPNEARSWYLQAIAQTPLLREPYIDYASFLMQHAHFKSAEHVLEAALELNAPSKRFSCNNAAYSSLPYDMLSICCYRLSDKKSARYWAGLALSFGENARIRNNLDRYFCD